MQTETNPRQSYTPYTSAVNQHQNNMPVVDESQLTAERMLLIAAGVLQYVTTQKLFRGIVVAIVGSVVASVGIRALIRSRRRPRPWTERVAAKLGIDFDAREAEESIKNLGREVERLRKEVEERLQR